MKHMYPRPKQANWGFTLIELLVVITIIGILSAIVLVSLNDARMKGRDGARKSQIQEIIKALELFYSDGGVYPNDGTPANNTTGAPLTTIGSGFIGGLYLNRLPDEPGRYYYCVSADGGSMILALNTEADRGGTEYCSVLRGPGPDYGCDFTAGEIDATDPCSTRF